MKCFGYPFCTKSRDLHNNLSLIKPDCIHQSFHRTVQVGIIENDVRRFSSQFESQFLSLTRGGLTDLRPTSVELVKATLSASLWVTIISPTLPSPVMMLTTPAAVRLDANLGKEQGGQRGVFSGLDHHGISHGESRGDFPMPS